MGWTPESEVMGGAQEVTITRRGRYRSVQSLACRPQRYFTEAPTSAICGEERAELAFKWHKYELPTRLQNEDIGFATAFGNVCSG